MSWNESYYKAIYDNETDLWNEAMGILETENEDSISFKRAMDTLNIISNYNTMIHKSMMEKCGVDYHLKFKDK